MQPYPTEIGLVLSSSKDEAAEPTAPLPVLRQAQDEETSRGCEEGFSLVEALATLVVIGMIGLMLVQGLGTGRRVWERTGAAADGGRSVADAQSLLRNRIEQLFPATLYDQSPAYSDVDGSATKLTFLSSPPASVRPSPLRRYRLALTAGGDLILSSLSDVAADPHAGVITETLLNGVQALDIGYFGVAAPDETPRWRDEWQGETKPPQVVRVRLAFRPGAPRAWPDLMVRPLANIDSECLLDPKTHGCKGR